MRSVVFGATGYIGGRVVPALLDVGHQVRVVARAPDKLADAPWRDRVEAVRGDVTSADDVQAAIEGREVVYYLVHSLNRHDFVEVDRRAAQTVADAAARQGVKRIVYLGGIVPDGGHLSAHLASRAEVGRIFLAGATPAAVPRRPPAPATAATAPATKS